MRWNRNNDTIEWEGANESFHRFLRIAISSAHAGKLQCQSSGANTSRNSVLMSEFLRWAQSKGLPIPPELKPQEGAGKARADAGTSHHIEGIKGLRDLIAELGLALGDDAAVRSFAKKAGIMQPGDNPSHEKRSWDRAEIEPKLREAIKERLKAPTE